MRLENLYLESNIQDFLHVRNAMKRFIDSYSPDSLQNPDFHAKNLAGHMAFIGRKFEKKCPAFIKELRGGFDLQSIAQGTAEVGVKDLADHILSVFAAAGLVKYPNAGETFELSYEKSGLFRTHEFQVNPGQSIKVKTEQSGWYLHVGNRYLPLKKAVVVKA